MKLALQGKEFQSQYIINGFHNLFHHKNSNEIKFFKKPQDKKSETDHLLNYTKYDKLNKKR